MADFGEVGGETDDEAGEGPQTTAKAPAVRTGLLSSSSFPSILPGALQTDGPVIAPQPPILSGPLDHDVHTEVLQDILNAQARLPPLASAQRSGYPANWGGGWLNPPAPLITGPLDADTHAEVLRDIQNAQAQLPSASPQSADPSGNSAASNLFNPSSSYGLGNGGASEHGHTIGVPGMDDSAAGNDLESLLDGDIGISPPGIDTDASGFGFEALSDRVAPPAVPSIARGRSATSSIPMTYQLLQGSAGQIPSLFSTSARPPQLPKFAADHGVQLSTDGPAIVERDGQPYVWVETPTGTRLVPYVTMSASTPSGGLSPADRLGLSIMNPVSAIASTGAGLAGAKQSTQDAILLEGSAVETPLYAAGSIGPSRPARAAEVAAASRPIRAREITTHQDLVDRSVVGDNLEGHELWQHANLRAQGLASDRLSTSASQDNPVIALDRSVHQQVNAAPRAFDATAQTPIENINTNAQILRDLGVASESDIARLRQMAIKHANRNGH